METEGVEQWAVNEGGLSKNIRIQYTMRQELGERTERGFFCIMYREVHFLDFFVGYFVCWSIDGKY